MCMWLWVGIKYEIVQHKTLRLWKTFECVRLTENAGAHRFHGIYPWNWQCLETSTISMALNQTSVARAKRLNNMHSQMSSQKCSRSNWMWQTSHTCRRFCLIRRPMGQKCSYLKTTQLPSAHDPYTVTTSLICRAMTQKCSYLKTTQLPSAHDHNTVTNPRWMIQLSLLARSKALH